MIKRSLLLSIFFSFFIQNTTAQCLEVLDGNGVFSDSPYFISCTPGDYTIFIQPDRNIGPYIIDWGDGTANSTGAVLTTGMNVSHTYTATTDTFDITITNSANGCVINGVVVLERNPLASIQLPSGDDNFGCTPVQFRFINSSTQISETTTFTWDFGDGTPVQTFDHTNLGDTVLHTYLPGVGVQSCELNVTLTATNYCGSSTASFFPLRVWDLDEARITPSANLLCYPDTVVQYTNNTIRNCFPQGNQSQRYERWNFGDYWGLGRDSIIDWRPWNPPIMLPPPIAYPGVGVYFVTLQDSSFCGIDDVTISIEITNPPTSIITSDKDTICEGESVRFFNNSVGGANQYEWNFDQGAGYEMRGGGTKTRTYNNSGDYTIELVVGIAGAQGCRDTSSVDLHVLPSPTADFTFDTNNECDSMQVNSTNASTGAIATYNWNFGNGMTFNGISPPTQFYSTPGTYNVTLTVANNRGCLDTESKTIRVRETPNAGFTVSSVCLNTAASFVDQSTSGGDPITSYQWFFGDGFTSTQQNPSHLYTAFGTYTVRQIVNTGFCTDTASLTVTVENKPTTDFVSTPKQGCSDLTVSFTNQSSANATSFRWDFGDGSSPIFTRDTSHTFVNNGISDTNYIVQLVAFTAFGCTDTTYDTVSVFPVPLPSFTSDAVTDCGPVTVNFTNTTQGDSLDFFWNFGDGTAVVNDTNPSHTFNNTTLFISNYDVQLIVVSSNGCRDTTTQVVTVYPEPIFTFNIVPDSGCSPLSVRFPSVVGAVNYLWDFGDGSTASGPTPTHLYVNNTTNNQNYTVRLVAQNSFGCRDTTYGNVLVFPNPTAAFALDTNVGCQPLPIEVTNNSTGANQFNWDFGDGTNSTNPNSTFTKTYSNLSALTQFYDLRLIAETNNGCRDTSTRRVEVHPFVQAAFASDSVGCSPLAVPFTNQSLGAAIYVWDFGDGSSSVSVNANHTYTNSTTANQNFTAQLIAVSPQGCVDTTERNILVYPKPVASYTPSVIQGCQPLEVTFTNSSSLADSCSWTYGDMSSFNLCTPTNVHTYTNTSSFLPIDYLSQLVVYTNDGCSDTLEQNIRVNPQVIASFDSDTIGCSPLPVNFQNRSVGGQSYQWTFGDGSNSTNFNTSNVYRNSGLTDQNYTVQLITTSQYSCSDTAQKTIEVFAKPVANFAADLLLGCHPLPVTFTNSSQIADSCYFSYGDGNALLDSCFNTERYVYQNTISSVPITREAELFVFTNNGCSDTMSQSITINPEIVADFDSDTAGCSPLPVRFQNRSTGAQNFQWTFGDGNTSAISTPSNIYRNTGLTDQNYTVQLIATSQYSCRDTAEQVIEVFAKPVATFATDLITGCHPLPVTFTNNSQIADSCYFDYGDGNTLPDSCFITEQYTYQNTLSSIPVVRNATLFVYTNNGCSDTTSQQITINPQIIADFDADTAGCSPLPVSFQNRSTGAQNYQWDFGDGGNSFSNSPSTVYRNMGLTDQTYTIQLIASSQYNCIDTIEKNIEIFAKPIADFATDAIIGCHPLPINFTNNSQIADSCNLNLGDGNLVLDSCFNTYQHIYQNTLSSVPVSRNAELIVYTNNGCSDTSNQVLTINPRINADFDADSLGCSPLEIDFQNQSTGAQFFEWTYGDGGSSSQQDPTHFFINTGLTDVSFTTKLKVTSSFGCTDSLEQNITVYPKPTADYTINTNDGCQPLEVEFTNNSTITDSCIWIYGDGNQLSDCSPLTAHTYTNTLSLVPLNYESQLVILTDRGCSDTLSRNINVRPQVIADFSSDSISCAPLDATFRSQSFGAIAYSWDFGDGGAANGMITTHQFTNTGAVDSVYNVRLIAQSLYNCNDTAYRNVTVRPTPLVGFTATPIQQLFPNSTVNLTNTTNPGNWTYNWDFDDSTSSMLQNPGTHVYQSWGTYNIQLTASSAFCEDSASILVTIIPPDPIADFGDSATGCSPLEVTFVNRSQYGATYFWDFGDGGVSNSENPTHIYFNPGVYPVKLTVNGIAPGKRDEITKLDYIVVNETPRAIFTNNRDKVFIPNDPVVFSNFSEGADSFLWNFGDGNTTTERSPTYFYTEEGEFQVFMIAMTDEGCSDTAYAPTLILAELEGRVRVPNAFTPSKTGPSSGRVNRGVPLSGEINDIFYAIVEGSVKYELNIFNKWGELLFVSKDINIGWDGYYKGKLSQQDVYVWKVKVEYADGKKETKVGDLMLLR